MHTGALAEAEPEPGSGTSADAQSRTARESPVAGVRRTAELAVIGLFLVVFLGDLLLRIANYPDDGLGDVLSMALSNPAVYLLNIVLLALGFAALWAILGRYWAAMWVGALILAAIAAATVQKIEVRREPIFPSDLDFLSSPDFLLGMTSRSTRIVAPVAVVLSGLAVLLVARGLGRRYPRIAGRGPAVAKKVRIARVAILLLVVVVGVDATRFNDGNSVLRWAYDTGGANWRPANQQFSYGLNGYVAGFLSNLNVAPMDEPARYSRSAMNTVEQRYAEEARAVNQAADPNALDDVNVIVVLDEAFSDPTRVKGVRFDGDPIPFVRSLMKTVPSGNLLTQKLGAGTANVEFEALTGLSLANYAPEADTPYQMVIPEKEKFPSAVSMFEALGYQTVAIHPYKANMYRRSTVYPILGFDSFIDRDRMTFEDTVEDNSLVSDDATFREVERVIEKSARPLFANVVTMQNHYDYTGKYADPVEVTGADSGTEEQLGAYLRGLAYSDRAVKDFLGRLSTSPEKTAVIFYGDHLPGAYSGKVSRKNSLRTMRETPFFLWTNFKDLPAEKLPTTSPTHLLPLLLHYLNAPIPAFYAMLGDVRRELPAMSNEVYVASTDATVSPDKPPAGARDVLDDYELLQYDVSIGNGYGTDMFEVQR